MSDFESQYASISGGTYSKTLPTLEAGYTFTIQGSGYTGFTTATVLQSVNLSKEDYPISETGYPKSPVNSETYYYQMGAGWFESTPQHRSPEQPDLTNSVFTGSNPNYQTKLAPFTYGQEYLNVYKSFPFTNLGYTLSSAIDNNKTWVDTEIGSRSNLDGGYNSLYTTDSEDLVINVKNVDLYLNPGQGLSYDVWYMSREYNFPIANQGLGYVAPTRCNPDPISAYPHRGGVDSTVINPEPRKQTFFEFAQTFWKNTINVRNRQYATDGGTSGYPTLSSIYWNYLQSESLVGVQNDNFTYKTMIEYVSGMGDYWIRLVEQMIPASTIWNTGVKLENSIFHRQKFVWRRQRGCELVPILCKPCKFTGSIYLSDCNAWSKLCDRYPDSVLEFGNFNNVLASVINNWLNPASGVVLEASCDVNTTNSEWFVDININGSNIIQYPFFNGTGYNSISCGTEPVTQTSNSSSPCVSLWETALDDSLAQLISLGYDYAYEYSDGQNMGDPPTKVRIWNINCSSNPIIDKIQIRVGVQFTMSCQE
jgi:hypothetical protein